MVKIDTLPVPKPLKKHSNHWSWDIRVSCMKTILSSLSSLVLRTCQMKLEQQDYLAVEHQLLLLRIQVVHIYIYMLMLRCTCIKFHSQEMIFFKALLAVKRMSWHPARKITEPQTEHGSFQWTPACYDKFPFLRLCNKDYMMVYIVLNGSSARR